MPTTLPKYRVIPPGGYVEFRADHLDEATAHRDAHQPGCEIVTVTETVPDAAPAE